jgi:hypothetical protein
MLRKKPSIDKRPPKGYSALPLIEPVIKSPVKFEHKNTLEQFSVFN